MSAFAIIWEGLETALPIGVPGRQVQGVLPEAPVDLLLAVVNPGHRRAIAIESRLIRADAFDRLPSAKGVSMLVTDVGAGRAGLELQLTDARATEIFTSLAEDVASAAASATTEEAAVRAFIGRVASWMRLLARSPQGLTPEQQRGLYAELWFLREHMVTTLGPDDAVAAWRGPGREPHDFQAEGAAAEVKSSAANEPQVVHVNGERQLDDAGLVSLWLIHLSLDVHRGAGETLPDMVHTVRAQLAGGTAGDVFEEKLMEADYSAAHETIYRQSGFSLRAASAFLVANDFPRIVGRNLPEGVGGVHYKLAVVACAPFRSEISEAASAMSRTR